MVKFRIEALENFNTIIAPSDTLAQKYKVSVDELKKVNGLKDNIKEGDALRIPKKED